MTSLQAEEEYSKKNYSGHVTGPKKGEPAALNTTTVADDKNKDKKLLYIVKNF